MTKIGTNKGCSSLPCLSVNCTHKFMQSGSRLITRNFASQQLIQYLLNRFRLRCRRWFWSLRKTTEETLTRGNPKIDTHDDHPHYNGRQTRPRQVLPVRKR